MYAYVGSRTTRERNARGEGISVFKVDPETAALQRIQLLSGLENPSFLTLNARGDRLYAVHGDTTRVSAYAVDVGSGMLRALNTEQTQGKNPVDLAVDPSGKYLVVCNHIGASMAVLPIAENGSLLPLMQLVQVQGAAGPHRIEQPHAKPHACPFSPDGRYVVVPDKGTDRVLSFRFDEGRLSAPPVEVVAREASGPRHIAFHPSAQYAYCVNELDSTVTAYRYDANTGSLNPLQILSTLPSTFTGNSRAAEIIVSDDGRYVYASNRGHDSIAVFRVDAATGMLTWMDAHASGGRTPRYMTFLPGGRFMYALNEDSDSIVAMRVDGATGQLSPAADLVTVGSPVCMIFSRGRD
ncbi:lactonase family protein [Bordetella muralis]|uniref:lactonase family protein n=1 Tax=Bordetella muralis TaxID=1649130 RepID=UPI0039F11387